MSHYVITIIKFCMALVFLYQRINKALFATAVREFPEGSKTEKKNAAHLILNKN